MAAQSVLEIYDGIEDFVGILVAAELHASGAWELEFVENIRSSFKRYGAQTNLSPAQKSKLERIAKEA